MWKVDTQISLYNMPRAPSMMILKQVYRTCWSGSRSEASRAKSTLGPGKDCHIRQYFDRGHALCIWEGRSPWWPMPVWELESQSAMTINASFDW